MNIRSYPERDVVVYIRAAQKALLESVRDDQQLGQTMTSIFKGVQEIAEWEYPAVQEVEERSNREIEIFEKIVNPILGWGDHQQRGSRINPHDAQRIEEMILTMIQDELI